jgi:hypothetical protein
MGGALALSLLVLPAGLAAQSEIPRRPDGRPDLSGNYDISTLTRLQRDPKFGARLYLTEEEAGQIAEQAATREARSSAASDPDRAAPPKGGNVGGYNSFYMDGGTAAVAVGGRYRTSLLIDPPDGRLPAFTESGSARREGLYPFSKKNTGDAWWLDRDPGPYDGPESLSIADRCIYSAESTIPIQPKAYNNVKTIVQTDDHVMILIEWMHHARIIRLDSEHRPGDVVSRSGDSIGWWEGDTLVVDTTNFLAEHWPTTTLFGEPAPPADLHVVERFTRLDADTLLYRFTVTSSDFTAPYTAEYPWPATSDKLYEYACHEGNYAVGNILRGARILEREALDAEGTGGI